MNDMPISMLLKLLIREGNVANVRRGKTYYINLEGQ